MSGLIALELDPTLQNIYGDLGGDKVFIVNQFHKARGFRKIHLEMAQLGSSLEILHCVFFPDPLYELPIFGVDIVGSFDGISAAIVDLSPVEEKLPYFIDKNLSNLLKYDFKNIRQLPEWGDIFSPYVQFIRPDNLEESNQFLLIVENFIDILISHSLTIQPNSSQSPTTIERYKRQLYYCKQQKCNEKTRQVLTKIFGATWAEQYIELVLFDCPKIFQN